ncbi:MAG: hypothetical protein AAF802_13545 [Planctomycetota bacterium]
MFRLLCRSCGDRAFAWLWFAFVGFVFSAPAFAQVDATEGGRDSTQSTSGPANSADPTPTRVSVSPSVVQRSSPGHWGALTVVGQNPGQSDREEIVSVYVGGDTSQQYSAKFIVPANSRRQTWMPIYLPEDVSNNGITIPMTYMRLVEQDGTESLQRSVTNSATTDRTLMLTEREINTGLIVDAPKLEWESKSSETRRALTELIEKGRSTTILDSMELPPITFPSSFLPDSYRALDELDQIVVAGDGLRNDTAGMTQLRRWLRDGGRIWIMLDRTDPQVIRELLEGDAEFEVVDRTSLNEFDLEAREPLDPTKVVSSERWESEIPVDFVRVAVPDVEVIYSIDGWPAAYWQSVDGGEVLFTTLAGRGWLTAEEKPTPAYYRLSRRLFEPKSNVVDAVSAMKPLVNENIGYQIPRLSLAAMFLGFNTIALLGAGLWLMSKRRLERLAFIVPVISFFAAGGLFVIGSRNTSSIPSTVATGQVLVVNRATDEVDVQSMHAVYCQSMDQANLLADSEGSIVPMDRVDGIRRLTTDETGRMRWKSPDQPPGTVQTWRSETTLWNRSGLSLFGTFDADGFVGDLRGAEQLTVEDALIASFPSPSTAASSTVLEGESGSLTVRAGSGDRLEQNQFISETLMSDGQRLRQQFLRDIHVAAESNFLANGPQLLFWTQQLSPALSISDSFENFETSLVSVPLSLRAPAFGVPFRIPSTFVSTESYAASKGLSSIFDQATDQWLTDVTKPTESDLLFRFPDCLTGLKLTRVNVTMAIEASQRTVQMKGWVKGEPVVLFQAESPVGKLAFSIDNREALDVISNNGLLLTLSVSRPGGAQLDGADTMVVPANSLASSDKIAPAESTNITWQLNELTLDAEAILE